MNHDPSDHRQPNQGSALLLVLWVIAVLSFSLVMTTALLHHDFEVSGRTSAKLHARMLAEEALSLALHPQVEPGDPLFDELGDNQSEVTVEWEAEQGRIPINSVLQSDEGANFLKTVFESWGLNRDDSEVIIDRLRDWIDPDELIRLRGAEEEAYRNKGRMDQPFDRPFDTVDDIAFVLGFEVIEAIRPQWRDDFTVWGNGSIDVRTAPTDLIGLALGADTRLVDELQSTIASFDELILTADDQRVNDDQLLALLGVAESPLIPITATSTHFRVRVEAVVGSARHRLSAIYVRSGRSSRLLTKRSETL